MAIKRRELSGERRSILRAQFTWVLEHVLILPLQRPALHDEPVADFIPPVSPLYLRWRKVKVGLPSHDVSEERTLQDALLALDTPGDISDNTVGCCQGDAWDDGEEAEGSHRGGGFVLVVGT